MIEMYTREDCSLCEKSQNLLTENHREFTVRNIDQDNNRELIMDTYPEIKELPVIFIDNVLLGGYNALVAYLEKHMENKNYAD